MIGEEMFTNVLQELSQEIYSLNVFMQALGGILIFYVIFNLINVYINRKKKKQLEDIDKNILDIKKLIKDQNKILKKK